MVVSYFSCNFDVVVRRGELCLPPLPSSRFGFQETSQAQCGKGVECVGGAETRGQEAPPEVEEGDSVHRSEGGRKGEKGTHSLSFSAEDTAM